MSGSSERGRGVLTEADRAFLRGDRALSSVQAERNARARIRDRVYDALLDFEVLVEHLAARDVQLVFGKRADEADGAEAFDAFVSTLAFLYGGVDHTDLDFETVLREGVNLAEATEDRGATVDFDVTYHALDVDHLREKLDDGESLSLTEIAYLYESDDVSPEELAELVGESRAADVDDGRVQSKVTEF
ncbi:hypothetical protein [Halobacterium wangiae]|uniref:hypothetical protein n=1 Tax=Halobacterium wangiae TaxID=2902623 RepID=UPI001E5FD329|nr:hypothetical protein [Halobacterium wangiae]